MFLAAHFPYKLFTKEVYWDALHSEVFFSFNAIEMESALY